MSLVVQDDEYHEANGCLDGQVIDLVLGTSDSFLSEVYYSLYSPFLSLYPDMF